MLGCGLATAVDRGSLSLVVSPELRFQIAQEALPLNGEGVESKNRPKLGPTAE